MKNFFNKKRKKKEKQEQTIRRFFYRYIVQAGIGLKYVKVYEHFDIIERCYIKPLESVEMTEQMEKDLNMLKEVFLKRKEKFKRIKTGEQILKSINNN